nr:acetyl-CoA C-acyltransferase [Sterolibacterium sp.]
LLDRDETVRGNTTMETLGNLAPAFTMLGQAYGFDGVAMQKYPEIEKINHIHHPGNSSGIVDGASAVLLGSKAGGERAGLKARGRIVATATVGSEPTIMLDGPAAAGRRCLQKAGLKAEDIDLYELNEAFASVVLAFMDELKVPHDKMNVNGGAIAMGHPLGATGGMLVGTVLDELERRNLRYGMVALCEAAGMATATIIERI